MPGRRYFTYVNQRLCVRKEGVTSSEWMPDVVCPEKEISARFTCQTYAGKKSFMAFNLDISVNWSTYDPTTTLGHGTDEDDVDD